MERFIPSYDESDEEWYARFRADAEWCRNYATLRNGYWHVTSMQGWQQIRESGSIRRNLGGRFPKRFGDITDRSYGYKINAIALFDFATPSEEEVMRQLGNAWDVITDMHADQVFLQVERGRLDARIVPNSECWGRSDGKVLGGCIPFIEVWYPDDIPADAIVSAYSIRAGIRDALWPMPSSASGAAMPEEPKSEQ
jgi:hypothetical protein